MTDQVPDHTVFDELAVGHAVHALEPADEQRFLRHAGQCPRCQQSVTDSREVAVALADIVLPAEAVPAAEPGKQLGARILAAALADLSQRNGRAVRPPGAGAAGAGSEQQGPAGAVARDDGTAAPGDPVPSRVVPLRQRPSRRWQKPASIAAAVALIAGGGVWAGRAATTGGQQSLAACAHPHACPVVVLIAAATHHAAAKVVVQDGAVWMEPTQMAANPAGEIYVLWQITGAHTPLPVGSFDIRRGAQSAIRIGGLAAPYSGTWAFAISLEHGRTIPAKPSNPVALGQVS